MIKFPEMNIATSVVNRILNASRDIQKAQASRPAVPSAPNVPDAQNLGAAIDAGLSAPTAPVGQTDPTMAEDLTTQTLFR